MRDKNLSLVVAQLLKPENWRPNLSRISRKTGIPVATVFDNVKYVMMADIIRFHSEIKLNVEEKHGRKRNTAK